MACEGSVNGGYETATLSPKNKLKFLCSYGGRILPRPTDGKLKYVGGETRVIAIPRDIKFSELMRKLTTLFDGDMVLKYQLIPEDIDVLVSVRSDEDLKHMLDEYDRLESEGTPKFRSFLFHSNPIVVETQPFFPEPHAIEQRYLDAINGIVRPTANAKLSPTNANRPTFSISSACSSPKSTSPDCQTAETMTQEAISWSSIKSTLPPMHKVHSSPSLCSFNNPQPSTNVVPMTKHLIQPRHYYQLNQLQVQQQHHSGYQSPRPPHEFNRTNVTDRVSMPSLTPSLPVGRIDVGRSPMGPTTASHLPPSRQQRGVGGWNKYGHSDEFAVNGCGRIERTESNQWSPRKTFWE